MAFAKLWNVYIKSIYSVRFTSSDVEYDKQFRMLNERNYSVASRVYRSISNTLIDVCETRSIEGTSQLCVAIDF